MSILLGIGAFLIGSVVACVFWWAMIEAQTDIKDVNEPGTRGGDWRRYKR